MFVNHPLGEFTTGSDYYLNEAMHAVTHSNS